MDFHIRMLSTSARKTFCKLAICHSPDNNIVLLKSLALEHHQGLESPGWTDSTNRLSFICVLLCSNEFFSMSLILYRTMYEPETRNTSYQEIFPSFLTLVWVAKIPDYVINRLLQGGTIKNDSAFFNPSPIMSKLMTATFTFIGILDMYRKSPSR